MTSFFSNLGQSIYDTMIAGDSYLLILGGLGITILIAICAILIGTIIGCILALMKISDSKILRGIANLYTTVLRGIPLATQLMIFYFVVFAPLHLPRLLVAIISYGLNSGAYCTEIFRAGIQGVDKGQTEAGRSLGLSGFRTMMYIVLPQAAKSALPAMCNEFISLIKETSVLSYIALTELTKAGDYIRSRTFSAFTPYIVSGLLYLIVTLTLTTLIGKLERRLRNSDH